MPPWNMKTRTSLAAVRLARTETTTTPTVTTAANAMMSFHSRLRPEKGFLAFIIETIADAEHGQDVPRLFRVGFDLRPQVLDVRVDRPLVALVGFPLGRRKKLETRERAAGLPH